MGAMLNFGCWMNDNEFKQKALRKPSSIQKSTIVIHQSLPSSLAPSAPPRFNQKSEIRSQRSDPSDASSQTSVLRPQKSPMQIKSAKELEVYKKFYQLAMAIFELSKGFPPEERYALTSQIRRSSRSISMNLREKR